MVIDEHIKNVIKLYLSHSQGDNTLIAEKRFMSAKRIFISDLIFLAQTLDLTINDLLGPYSLTEYECGYIPLPHPPQLIDEQIRLRIAFLEKKISFDFDYLKRTFSFDEEKYIRITRTSTPLSVTDVFMLAYIYHISIADLIGPRNSGVQLREYLYGYYDSCRLEKEYWKDITNNSLLTPNEKCNTFFLDYIKDKQRKNRVFHKAYDAGFCRDLKTRKAPPSLLYRAYSPNVFFSVWFCCVSQTPIYTLLGIETKHDDFEIKEYPFFIKQDSTSSYKEIGDNRFILSKNLGERLYKLIEKLSLVDFQEHFHADILKDDIETLDEYRASLFIFQRRNNYVKNPKEKNRTVQLPSLDMVSRICAILGISIYDMLGFRTPDAINVKPKLISKYKSVFTERSAGNPAV